MKTQETYIYLRLNVFITQGVYGSLSQSCCARGTPDIIFSLENLVKTNLLEVRGKKKCPLHCWPVGRLHYFTAMVRMLPLPRAKKIISVLPLALLSGVGPGTIQTP